MKGLLLLIACLSHCKKLGCVPAAVCWHHPQRTLISDALDLILRAQTLYMLRLAPYPGTRLREDATARQAVPTRCYFCHGADFSPAQISSTG